MAINNILDMIAQGVRESNPVYRDKQKQLQEQQARMAEITQQQLFQANQHANDRSTLTEFEKQQLAQHQAEVASANEERYGKALASGDITTEPFVPTIPSVPGNVSGSMLNHPAQTGPGDATTNGPGGLGGNGSQGALTPTTASASAAPSGGIGDSGGGPSAPSIASLLLPPTQPQGPLTGLPGAAPQGNTTATTQTSRANSAQSGPLAQIEQGSTTPSETAAGATGSGSGPLPSPAQKAIAGGQAPPSGSFEDLMKQRGARWTTQDEKQALTMKQARAAAAVDRQVKIDAVNAFEASATTDPEVAQLIKNNPNLIGSMKAQVETGIKPPPTTAAAMAQALADASARGDSATVDALTKGLTAMHPSKAQPDLGGFMHSGMEQNGVDSLAVMFNKTGRLPALGMGGLPLRTAVIQRAADLDPTNDLAASEAGYKSDSTSLTNLKKGYDAMSAFEDTGNANLKMFLKQAQDLANNNADLGVPLLNTPLRNIQKALGQADIPAYQAARQAAIGEISRVLTNPNLVGVLPEGARKEVTGFVPDNATYGQLQEVARVLTSDMSNRKDAYERQIARITDRIKNKTTVGQENVSTPPPTVPPPATTNGNPPGKKYAATDTDNRSGEPVGSDDGWKTIYEIRTGKKLQ